MPMPLVRLAFPRSVFLLALFCRFASAEFRPHFSQWLAQRFGEDVRNNLERRDLGIWGSFGGRTAAEEPIRNQPVVFVHGVSNRACDKMKQSADFFFNHGYTFSELYGTTYANGDQGNPLQWAAYSMKCHYVKLVRALIVAVRLYTGKQVDVVAYSLGVPVSRKAILGGICVDTGENLGGSLTKYVDTFIGVAGPNHGISLQLGALSVPGCLLSVLPVCNAQTGLYSGFCPAESAFLQDINRQQAYEGQNRFSIYSTRDQVIGHKVCGRVTSQLPGQHGEKVYDNADHDGAFLHSFPVQHAMVLNHALI
ncbi:hypothetical protein niasHS_003750 [Heterodera schachtii]|uniref:Triacylglycerol lipase n=2 Tax=Heterodera TaxID=34509 RepID=A0ABD2KHH8_HETSC